MSNIQLSKVKYIAFDFCGTLADIFPTTGSILSQFFRENYQLELQEDILSSVIEKISREIPYSSVNIITEASKLEYYTEFNTRMLGEFGCDPSKSAELYDFFRAHDRHWAIESETHALLEVLRFRGYHLIVASNFVYNLDSLLRRLGLFNLFCDLFVSAAIGVEKPSSAFYELIPVSLECYPHEIMMVGDDLFLDVYPSVAVGFHSVHIEKSRYNCDNTVKDFRGLEYMQISKLSSLLDILPESGPPLIESN